MKPCMKSALLAAGLAGMFLLGGCAAALLTVFAGRRTGNRNEIGLQICCPDLHPILTDDERPEEQ